MRKKALIRFQIAFGLVLAAAVTPLVWSRTATSMGRLLMDSTYQMSKDDARSISVGGNYQSNMRCSYQTYACPTLTNGVNNCSAGDWSTCWLQWCFYCSTSGNYRICVSYPDVSCKDWWDGPPYGNACGSHPCSRLATTGCTYTWGCATCTCNAWPPAVGCNFCIADDCNQSS